MIAGYGLIQLPLPGATTAVVQSTPEWRRQVVAQDQPVAVARHFLDTVTWPPTRYVLFALDATWTVVVNNQRGGSDVADLVRAIRRSEPALAVRVVDHDAVDAVQNGFRVRTQYEARMVEIQSDGEVRRTITCADDGGRWSFETTGAPLPVEAQFDYEARRRRDRFTRQDLDALLQSLGASAVTEADFDQALGFTLLTSTPHDPQWLSRIEALACTAAEAADPAHGYWQRGMSWVDHIETHAPSVVADLGKAMLLNPAFEERCRPALEMARTHLGDDAFAELLAQAELGLPRT